MPRTSTPPSNLTITLQLVIIDSVSSLENQNSSNNTTNKGELTNIKLLAVSLVMIIVSIPTPKPNTPIDESKIPEIHKFIELEKTELPPFPQGNPEPKEKVVKIDNKVPKQDFGYFYENAGRTYDIHPGILKAVHFVETGMDGDTCRGSSAGAMGPMQFMEPTFNHYKVDGSGDGLADICSVQDSIYTAAHYLQENRDVSGSIGQALYQYNHSMAYVNKVINLARTYGYAE